MRNIILNGRHDAAFYIDDLLGVGVPQGEGELDAIFKLVNVQGLQVISDVL